MKKIRLSEIVILVIVIVSAIIGVYFYPYLPDKIASHWNIKGDVDGYMSKFWGIFLMPMISFVLFLFFLIFPKIDPKKENIEKFRKYFDYAMILIFLFLLYIYLLTIFWNLNYRFNLIQFISPAFGILFYYLGVLVSHAQMNWTIGIRTPWTLSSETVWKKTHQIGGLLFRISGLIAVFGILFPQFAIWLVLAPLIATTIFSFIYSYILFRKEKH